MLRAMSGWCCYIARYSSTTTVKQKETAAVRPYIALDTRFLFYVKVQASVTVYHNTVVITAVIGTGFSISFVTAEIQAHIFIPFRTAECPIPSIPYQTKRSDSYHISTTIPYTYHSIPFPIYRYRNISMIMHSRYFCVDKGGGGEVLRAWTKKHPVSR